VDYTLTNANFRRSKENKDALYALDEGLSSWYIGPYKQGALRSATRVIKIVEVHCGGHMETLSLDGHRLDIHGLSGDVLSRKLPP
jgi:hypothetical protein